MQKEAEERKFWSEIKERFPPPSLFFKDPSIGKIYFNDASIGIPPTQSIKAAVMEFDRYHKKYVRLDENFKEQLNLVEETRVRVSKLLGTKPQNIVFDNNTTEAMKLVAAMVLKEGDEFITTTREYFPSMRVFFDPLYRLPPPQKMRPLRQFQLGRLPIAEFTATPSLFDEVGLTMQNYALDSDSIKHRSAYLVQLQLGERRYLDVKMRVVNVGRNDEEMLANIENAINEKTKLIVVSHVFRGDGGVAPVEKISEIAKKHSDENRKVYFLIDGAQVLGNLHPSQINVEGIGCDFYVASAHKTLLSEPATGILYISERNAKLIQKLLEPNPYFGTAPLFELKAFQFHPDNQPINIFKGERRTINDWASLDERTLSEFRRISTPEIASLNESLKFFDEIGWDKVHERIKHLKEYAVDKLKTIPHMQILSPHNSSPAILAFSLENISSQKVVEELHKRGIETTYIPKPDSVRVSFSIRNNEEEIDELAKVLAEITASDEIKKSKLG
ncbi:MAG: aminotransferase class V-fold PLP-dependent enzyme [Candidatus Micrarchaeia archaeon]